MALVRLSPSDPLYCQKADGNNNRIEKIRSDTTARKSVIPLVSLNGDDSSDRYQLQRRARGGLQRHWLQPSLYSHQSTIHVLPHVRLRSLVRSIRRCRPTACRKFPCYYKQRSYKEGHLVCLFGKTHVHSSLPFFSPFLPLSLSLCFAFCRSRSSRTAYDLTLIQRSRSHKSYSKETASETTVNSQSPSLSGRTVLCSKTSIPSAASEDLLSLLP